MALMQIFRYPICINLPERESYANTGGLASTRFEINMRNYFWRNSKSNVNIKIAV